MRSARVGDRSGVRVDETGARFSRKTRVPDGDARVGPRTAPGARAAARETNPKPNWRARVAVEGGRVGPALTSKEGELAQRVDVQLHAEPQRGADECGAHVTCTRVRRNPARGAQMSE